MLLDKIMNGKLGGLLGGLVDMDKKLKNFLESLDKEFTEGKTINGKERKLEEGEETVMMIHRTKSGTRFTTCASSLNEDGNYILRVLDSSKSSKLMNTISKTK